MLVLRHSDCGPDQSRRSIDCSGWRDAGKAAQTKCPDSVTAMAWLALVRPQRFEASGPAGRDQWGRSSVLELLLSWGEILYRLTRRALLRHGDLHGPRQQRQHRGTHARGAAYELVSHIGQSCRGFQ